MRVVKSRIAASLGITAVVAAVALAVLTTGGAGVSAAATSYPRNETLYTSGTQWGDIQGFNPYASSLPHETGGRQSYGTYATGTVGLAYETLFRYDPLEDEYISWLAQSGRWTGPRSYTLTIRSGITWSDGTPFTADDVAWNVELGRFDTAFWHRLYEQLAIGGVTVSGETVSLAFRETPNYAEWMTLLWNLPMVSPAQWADVTSDTLTTFSPVPIGTGPYVLDESGYDPATQVVWMKSPGGWWAASRGLAPDPKPMYIIDRLNKAMLQQLANLVYGLEDLNNTANLVIPTFLPGDLDLHTYYSKAPYHLSANTVWLVPNTTRQPLDDAQFRRALAEAIDVDQIVANDYDNDVAKADPTGLLPTWSRYIDKSVVARYGFSYSVKKAKATLRAAGYTDSNGDGYVENKDGSPIDLSLTVPVGWFDWTTAIKLIENSVEKAGIKITSSYVDYGIWVDGRNSGNFDLVLDNTAFLSDTPWTYFDYLFRQPVGAQQTSANFGRFSGAVAEEAWNLTQQLDQTPPGDTAAKRAIITQLERITLQQLPAIPLWHTSPLVAVQQPTLDELALREGLAELCAHHVERLPPDDGHRHDHPPGASAVTSP